MGRAADACRNDERHVRIPSLIDLSCAQLAPLAMSLDYRECLKLFRKIPPGAFYIFWLVVDGLSRSIFSCCSDTFS